MPETCKTCRFWNHAAAYSDGQKPVAQCRIRSAVNFPIRAANDWCGEHKPVTTNANPVTLLE